MRHDSGLSLQASAGTAIHDDAAQVADAFVPVAGYFDQRLRAVDAGCDEQLTCALVPRSQDRRAWITTVQLCVVDLLVEGDIRPVDGTWRSEQIPVAARVTASAIGSWSVVLQSDLGRGIGEHVRRDDEGLQRGGHLVPHSRFGSAGDPLGYVTAATCRATQSTSNFWGGAGADSASAQTRDDALGGGGHAGGRGVKRDGAGREPSPLPAAHPRLSRAGRV
jgi:hypothetical protein